MHLALSVWNTQQNLCIRVPLLPLVDKHSCSLKGLFNLFTQLQNKVCLPKLEVKVLWGINIWLGINSNFHPLSPVWTLLWTQESFCSLTASCLWHIHLPTTTFRGPNWTLYPFHQSHLTFLWWFLSSLKVPPLNDIKSVPTHQLQKWKTWVISVFLLHSSAMFTWPSSPLSSAFTSISQIHPLLPLPAARKGESVVWLQPVNWRWKERPSDKDYREWLSAGLSSHRFVHSAMEKGSLYNGPCA